MPTGTVLSHKAFYLFIFSEPAGNAWERIKQFLVSEGLMFNYIFGLLLLAALVTD